MSSVRLANSFLIAAHSRNGVIGNEGAIPWHAPHDLRFFSLMTKGAVLIMGRATHESLPAPLAGRTSIVLSRSPIRGNGVIWAQSMVDAIDQALKVQTHANAIAFIGGADVYRQALELPWLSKAVITEVDIVADGDRHMPQLGPEWTLVHRTVDFGESPVCTFSEYRRSIGVNNEGNRPCA